MYMYVTHVTGEGQMTCTSFIIKYCPPYFDTGFSIGQDLWLGWPINEPQGSSCPRPHHSIAITGTTPRFLCGLGDQKFCLITLSSSSGCKHLSTSLVCGNLIAQETCHSVSTSQMRMSGLPSPHSTLEGLLCKLNVAGGASMHSMWIQSLSHLPQVRTFPAAGSGSHHGAELAR